jgi:hypothetical protein
MLKGIDSFTRHDRVTTATPGHGEATAVYLPYPSEWFEDPFTEENDVSVGSNPIDAVLADQGVVSTAQAKLTADEAADQATITAALATEGTDDAAAYAAVQAAGNGTPVVHLVFTGTPPVVTGAYLCTPIAPVDPTTTGTVTIAPIPLV